MSSPKPIEREEVARLLQEDAQLVEVLSAEAYEKEHIAGAVSIPLEDLDEKAPERLARDRPVIVYCYDPL